MRDQKKRALYLYEYWKRKCEELGAFDDAVTAVTTVTTKENEKENENLPPTPPIRVKEKEKEKDTHTSRARECETGEMFFEPSVGMGATIKPPTFAEVLDWVKLHNSQHYPENILREWFDECEFCDWRDNKNNPIRNWKNHLKIWRDYYDLRKKKTNPERIADVRKPTIDRSSDMDDSPSAQDLNQLFNSFWLAYPRKAARQDAFNAFKTKLNENQKDPVAFVNQLCESVKRNRETNKDWLKDNGQFIPYPATWLRQERWLDESFDPEAEERKRQAEIEARCDAMAEEFFKNFGSDANGKHL